MKPNPLEPTGVISHTSAAAAASATIMSTPAGSPGPVTPPPNNNHVVERRAKDKGHRCKVKTPPTPGRDGIISPLSPRNADVVFQTLDWDMHCEENESYDCSTPSGSSNFISAQKHPVVFRWHGEARTVFLSGSFDNWKSKIPLVRSNDELYTIVEVPLGVHQYKFLVDGRWACLPDEPQVVGDIGTPNNVISVTESDCDPFAALEKDDVVGAASGGESSAPGPNFSPIKAPSTYSQYIPPRDPAGFNFLRHGPPLLPPHLLQSVLNAEVAPHMDPIMLPPPNHVVLDHTFTLSIRDGVMVLSTTHRYRQKFVTTLLYRPI